jgi:hypothetical protein
MRKRYLPILENFINMKRFSIDKNIEFNGSKKGSTTLSPFINPWFIGIIPYSSPKSRILKVKIYLPIRILSKKWSVFSILFFWILNLIVQWIFNSSLRTFLALSLMTIILVSYAHFPIRGGGR